MIGKGVTNSLVTPFLYLHKLDELIHLFVIEMISDPIPLIEVFQILPAQHPLNIKGYGGKVEIPVPHPYSHHIHTAGNIILVHYHVGESEVPMAENQVRMDGIFRIDEWTFRDVLFVQVAQVPSNLLQR